MKCIAAVANAGASHQMALSAIGRALRDRGHRFVLFGTNFQARQLRLPDLAFHVVGQSCEDPAEKFVRRVQNEGKADISTSLDYMCAMAELLCTELPSLLRKLSIDFVIADQEEPGAATAADLAGLPYVNVCTSLPLNEDPSVPPGFLPWRYSPSVFASLRNRAAYTTRNVVIRRVNRILNAHRNVAKLRPYSRPDDSFSKRAQITQMVRQFDFPRSRNAGELTYVGPYQRSALFAVDFPYELLSDKPLIYASFGTSFGKKTADLQAIAAACATLPVQLVISLGGVEKTEQHDQFPGKPIIVSYAPQREILARSAVAITHGGLNSTMEALSLGVPLLAMPVAGDQFGVAERVNYHGVGKVLSAGSRGVEQIRAAVLSLMHDQTWRQAAQQMSRAIANSGGAMDAAQVIESLLV